jgi:hypothetical protein
MNKRLLADITRDSARGEFKALMKKLARRMVYENGDGKFEFNTQQNWKDIGAFEALSNVLCEEDK